MSDLTPKSITQEGLKELRILSQNGQRTLFYLKYYELTGSQESLKLAKISSFSGIWGGSAERANKKLESNPKYPKEGVIWFSRQVQKSVLKAIEDSYNSGKGGAINDRDMVYASNNPWRERGMGDDSPVNAEEARLALIHGDWKSVIDKVKNKNLNLKDSLNPKDLLNSLNPGTVNAIESISNQGLDLSEEFFTGEKAEYGKTEKDFDLTSGDYKSVLTKDMTVFYIVDKKTGAAVFVDKTGAVKAGKTTYVVEGESEQQISIKYNIPIDKVIENTPIDQFDTVTGQVKKFTILIDSEKNKNTAGGSYTGEVEVGGSCKAENLDDIQGKGTYFNPDEVQKMFTSLKHMAYINSRVTANQNGALEIKVAKGNTLSLYSNRIGIGLKQIIELNPELKSNPNLIKPGQIIKLTQASSVINTEAKLTSWEELEIAMGVIPDDNNFFDVEDDIMGFTIGLHASEGDYWRQIDRNSIYKENIQTINKLAQEQSHILRKIITIKGVIPDKSEIDSLALNAKHNVAYSTDLGDIVIYPITLFDFKDYNIGRISKLKTGWSFYHEPYLLYYLDYKRLTHINSKNIISLENEFKFITSHILQFDGFDSQRSDGKPTYIDTGINLVVPYKLWVDTLIIKAPIKSASLCTMVNGYDLEIHVIDHSRENKITIKKGALHNKRCDDLYLAYLQAITEAASNGDRYAKDDIRCYIPYSINGNFFKYIQSEAYEWRCGSPIEKVFIESERELLSIKGGDTYCSINRCIPKCSLENQKHLEAYKESLAMPKLFLEITRKDTPQVRKYLVPKKGEKLGPKKNTIYKYEKGDGEIILSTIEVWASKASVVTPVGKMLCLDKEYITFPLIAHSGKGITNLWEEGEKVCYTGSIPFIYLLNILNPILTFGIGITSKHVCWKKDDRDFILYVVNPGTNYKKTTDLIKLEYQSHRIEECGLREFLDDSEQATKLKQLPQNAIACWTYNRGIDKITFEEEEAETYVKKYSDEYCLESNTDICLAEC